MANPVFSSSTVFGEAPRRARGVPSPKTVTFNAPGTTGQAVPPVQPMPTGLYGSPQPPTAQSAPQGSMTPEQLQAMYQGPTAGSVDMNRMSYDDVIVRTGLLLLVILAAGAATWVIAPGLFPLGAIVGLVLGLVNSFKKKPSPALIMAYGVAEGVFLGGISRIFEETWQGVVVQAVLATAATFIACLLLYSSGRVRVTGKFMRVLMVAMVGYLIYSLINFALVAFNVMPGFGINSMQLGNTGIPLGVLIGIVAVFLASMCLMMDFESIKRGVEAGAPRQFAWTAAFGLAVTIVWMYLEFLRLLALFRD